MAFRSPGKLIGRLTQPAYGVLRSLTDGGPLDAASLETSVTRVVADRFQFARSLIRAAKVLAESEDPLVRRSAVSRAYYGAYHAARATVFEVERRDEDDHEKLPAVVDLALRGQVQAGDILKDLRRLRNEMDYAPYPGPNPETQYDAQEIENAINESIRRAESLVDTLKEHLEQRR
jgi:uncharacterized protein (UPF0332 family)